MILSATLAILVTAHLSVNGFYDRIDASNLGYGQDKSILSWSGAFTVNLNLTKAPISE